MVTEGHLVYKSEKKSG